MVLDLIQKPTGTLDILVFLSRNGPSDVTTIMKELGMYARTFYSAVHRLKSLGLVYDETETGWPTRVVYQLTYKGEDLVKHLIPIERMVSESIVALKEELKDLESARKTRKNTSRMLELLSVLQETTYDLGKWDETLRLCACAIDLCGSAKDQKNLSHACRYAADIYQKRGEHAKARENLEKSMQASTELEDWEGLAQDHYILGGALESSGDLEGAFKEYQESLGFAERAGWKIGEARARLGFGRVLGKRDKFQESLREIRQAVDIFEELNAVQELPRAYANLAASTFFVDRAEGLKYHEKSIEIARRTGDVRILAFGLSNASACLSEKGEYKKALEYLKEAEDILLRLGEKRALSSVFIQRGAVYTAQRDWKRAEEAYLKSIALCEEVDSKYNLADTYFNYGKVMLERDRVRKGKTYLRKAMRIFEELGSEGKISSIRECYNRYVKDDSL